MIHYYFTVIIIVLTVVFSTCHADTNSYPDILVAVDSGKLPEVEIKLLEWIDNHPQDQSAHFDLARVLAWQGKGSEALQQYRILLRLSPNNADYLLGKAQTLIWTKKPKEALTLLARARTVAPEYLDVWKLEIATLNKLPGNTNHQKAKKLIAQAQRLFPNENWQDSTIVKPASGINKRPTTVSFGFAYENLSGNRDSWMTWYLSASHQYNSKLSTHARIENVSRYSLTDRAAAIGVNFKMAAKWRFMSELIYSPSPNFLPEYSLSAVVSRILRPTFSVQVGAKLTQYNETNVKTVILTLEKYWHNTRWAYTLNPAFVQSTGRATTHHFQANVYFQNNANLGAGYSFGDELEYSGVGSHSVYEIQTITLSTQYGWTQDWVSVFSFSHHKQGELYIRNGIHLGIRHQF